MTSQPRPEVNKQPNTEGSEAQSEVPELIETENNNSRTASEQDSREEFNLEERNYSPEPTDEDMQIDGEVNIQQDQEHIENKQVEGKRLYSQAVSQSAEGETKRRPKEVNMYWADEVSGKMENTKVDDFNEEEWHYAKVLEAFKNEEKMKQFIIHKLQTKPTQHVILTAIALKFKHTDKNFFRTFTRNKMIMPSHQKEYEAIVEKATENYKGKIVWYSRTRR